MAGIQTTPKLGAAKTAVVVKAPVAPKKAVASVLAASLMMCAAPTFAFDADVLADGKRVFNGNCAACHAGGKNSVIAERTLSKGDISKYLDGGFNLDAVKNQVINGKGAMPAWADRLDDDEIDAVSSYVIDMAEKW